MAHFEKSFTAVSTSLEDSRRFIKSVLDELNLSHREIDLQLAIGEVTQNVIRHGFKGGDENGVMTVKIDADQDRLICVIEDNAEPADSSDWVEKAEARRPDEGGYGLSIIHAIADEYKITPDKDGNTFRLVFSLTDQE